MNACVQILMSAREKELVITANRSVSTILEGSAVPALLGSSQSTAHIAKVTIP